MNLTRLVKHLTRIDEMRWEWHVMLPKNTAESKNNEFNVLHLAQKLKENSAYRKEFLKEVNFFQEYSYYSKNTELQNLLKAIEAELKENIK